VSREQAYRFHSPLKALDYDLFDVHFGPVTSRPQIREAMRIGLSPTLLIEDTAMSMALLHLRFDFSQYFIHALDFQTRLFPFNLCGLASYLRTEGPKGQEIYSLYLPRG
jgi:hypothetical protein